MKPPKFHWPAALLLTCLLALLTGCVTGKRLETGGAYAATDAAPSHAELYVTDASFDLAYSALDTVFKYERGNRISLWAISPNIKHALDKLRLEAAVVVQDYALARQTYLAAPSPANLEPLTQLIARLQAANTAALAVIANKGNP